MYLWVELSSCYSNVFSGTQTQIPEEVFSAMTSYTALPKDLEISIEH